MTYSRAVFETPDQTLADAQRSKYRRHGRATPGSSPGMHVLEIGCGWGGFALYAAGERGCRVTSITISKRAARAGPQRIRDGRAGGPRRRSSCATTATSSGTYDAVVSIEMLEAVGAEYYETYFAAADRALKPGGRIEPPVDQLPRHRLRAQRRGANWIQTYIFPGGFCPSVAAIERSLRGTRLIVREPDDIGPSYVRTLPPGASVHGACPSRARDGLRRALHQDVGVLPGVVPGRLRDRPVQDQQLVLEKGAAAEAWPQPRKGSGGSPTPPGRTAKRVPASRRPSRSRSSCDVVMNRVPRSRPPNVHAVTCGSARG